MGLNDLTNQPLVAGRRGGGGGLEGEMEYVLRKIGKEEKFKKGRDSFLCFCTTSGGSIQILNLKVSDSRLYG